MNREMTEMELTSAQGRIIGYLTHHPQVPCARDLEEFFGLSHSTISGLLSRMEAKGFIRQESDPDDRRIKRIYLLEKGHACSRRIQTCIENNERLMVWGFSEEETEQFRAFLQRAKENLGQKAPQFHFHQEEKL